MSWTPKELIESLQKWHPDQPIEVAQTGGHIVLVQNTNSINLTAEDDLRLPN